MSLIVTVATFADPPGPPGWHRAEWVVVSPGLKRIRYETRYDLTIFLHNVATAVCLAAAAQEMAAGFLAHVERADMAFGWERTYKERAIKERDEARAEVGRVVRVMQSECDGKDFRIGEGIRIIKERTTERDESRAQAAAFEVGLTEQRLIYEERLKLAERELAAARAEVERMRPVVDARADRTMELEAALNDSLAFVPAGDERDRLVRVLAGFKEPA